MTNILVAMQLEEHHKQQFSNLFTDCTLTFERRPSDEQIADADAVVGNIDPERLLLSKKLKFVQLQSAGVGNMSRLLTAGRDIRLCNASGSYGLAISEHMFGILLGLQKRLFGYRDQQRSGQWKDLGPVRSVSGSNVLVIGMGDIGSAFAKRCHAFGASVRGVRRSSGKCPEYCVETGTSADVDRWLPEADIIFMCMPETHDTIGFMNRERLGRVKTGAILLNAGRGTAIDTIALVDALNAGRLAAVGLDVTEPEPLPSNHPLWACPNAMITPHVSGGMHLQQTHDNIVSLACRNLRAWLTEAPLTNEVDYERGY